jgi:hypothetical protein
LVNEPGLYNAKGVVRLTSIFGRHYVLPLDNQRAGLLLLRIIPCSSDTNFLIILRHQLSFFKNLLICQLLPPEPAANITLSIGFEK